jgi:asparagine synthase (glutamine-hydrolysing)
MLSERPYIDDVVAGGNFDVRMHEVGAYDPFAGAEEALVRHAGPVVAPNLLMMRPLYDDAREGAVLLDGHGGDEVVSKWLGRLHDLARAGAWMTLYRELRGVADLYGERASTMLFVLFRAYGPGRHKLSALVRGFERLSGRTAAQDSPLNVLSASFRQRSGIDEEMAARWRPRSPDGREADHAVLLEPQQPYALEVLDREAQDAGVEVRCPFWDRRLIDYSMSLPASAKLKDGWTRLILRQAMTGVLPPKVLWRRDKHDFSVQLRDGLRSSPVITPEAIKAARAELSRHLDVDRVLDLRARLDDHNNPLAGKDLQTLWRVGLWSIWLWLQRARPVP